MENCEQNFDFPSYKDIINVLMLFGGSTTVIELKNFFNIKHHYSFASYIEKLSKVEPHLGFKIAFNYNTTYSEPGMLHNMLEIYLVKI